MPESDPARIDPRKASSQSSLEIWREAMAHLRHLSDDVWQGLRVFLTLHGFILVAIVTLIALGQSNKPKSVLLLVLSILGALLSFVARATLKRHRVYYLQMLAKKTLLEDELGFYQRKLAGSETDLAFPWRLTPEVVAEIRQNFEAWVQKSIRAKGTIALLQFRIYETLASIYALAFLLAAVHLWALV